MLHQSLRIATTVSMKLKEAHATNKCNNSHMTKRSHIPRHRCWHFHHQSLFLNNQHCFVARANRGDADCKQLQRCVSFERSAPIIIMSVPFLEKNDPILIPNFDDGVGCTHSSNVFQQICSFRAHNRSTELLTSLYKAWSLCSSRPPSPSEWVRHIFTQPKLNQTTILPNKKSQFSQ